MNLENYKRNKILVPDSAHGTNPASAAMAGLKVIEIPHLRGFGNGMRCVKF